jgi:hypothetical protein
MGCLGGDSRVIILESKDPDVPLVANSTNLAKNVGEQKRFSLGVWSKETKKLKFLALFAR